MNIPHFNFVNNNEEILPIGWHLVFQNLYSDMKFEKPETSSSQKKIVKKIWQNANLTKLEKKFEELAKTIEEPKESDSPERQQELVMARNYINRMNYHLKEVHALTSILNVYGFAPVLVSQEI